MRFFLDTEFSERGPQYPVELISIGLVSENGDTLYGVSSEFDENSCNDWVKANVLPNLGREGNHRIPLSDMALSVEQWVNFRSNGERPVFWGYYAAYDWVVFAQMFGTMMDLPKDWPMMCHDLKQWCNALGNPTLPAQTSTEHNALADALWNKDVYDFLNKLEVQRAESR